MEARSNYYYSVRLFSLLISKHPFQMSSFSPTHVFSLLFGNISLEKRARAPRWKVLDVCLLYQYCFSTHWMMLCVKRITHMSHTACHMPHARTGQHRGTHCIYLLFASCCWSWMFELHCAQRFTSGLFSHSYRRTKSVFPDIQKVCFSSCIKNIKNQNQNSNNSATEWGRINITIQQKPAGVFMYCGIF